LSLLSVSLLSSCPFPPLSVLVFSSRCPIGAYRTRGSSPWTPAISFLSVSLFPRRVGQEFPQDATPRLRTQNWCLGSYQDHFLGVNAAFGLPSQRVFSAGFRFLFRDSTPLIPDREVWHHFFPGNVELAPSPCFSHTPPGGTRLLV